MNSTRKKACLGLLFLFVLVFISSLYAESPHDEESILEEPFLGEETSPGEEPLLAEEAPLDENLSLDENPSLDETPSLSEEPSLDEDALLSEEFFFDDDDLLFFEAPSLIFEVSPFSGPRSFDEIFPGLSQEQKAEAMDEIGLRHYFEKNESPLFMPDPDSGIELLSSVMQKKPSHIIEALVVVPYVMPYSERELDILDIYNALGKIEDIKEYSFSLNDRDIYIFSGSTRLESPRNRISIPDPPPADTLPYSDTIHLRLTEKHFGDLFVRADISMSLYGITYSMTNFTDVRYSLFRVMRAERFSVIIYLEPVKEGILIYSMSGFYLPGFLASKVNLTPSINYRMTALLNWITGGLRREEANKVMQFLMKKN